MRYVMFVCVDPEGEKYVAEAISESVLTPKPVLMDRSPDPSGPSTDEGSSSHTRPGSGPRTSSRGRRPKAS
jgi:hypothetical protein